MPCTTHAIVTALEASTQMPVQSTSRDAYYKAVLSGKIPSHKARIMRFLLQIRRPVTRHEIVDTFFCAQPGPRALDGGRVIPWQSAGSAIASMVCRIPHCEHALCRYYIAVDHVGECPITHERSEFLVPIGEQWRQRRIF